MVNSSHLKIRKNECDDHKTRAKRLKQIRRLLNMDREEFAECYNFNSITYKDWETARRNTIPTPKAEELFEKLRDQGVFASIEWFLTGVGPEPYRLLNWENKEIKLSDDLTATKLFIAEDKHIKEELAVFLKNHPSAIWFVLSDDAMAPFYQKSDLVAGQKYEKKDIHRLIGRDCIVEYNSQYLLRKIQPGREAGLYSLIATQAATGQDQIIYDVQLDAAAPVIWVRRQLVLS